MNRPVAAMIATIRISNILFGDLSLTAQPFEDCIQFLGKGLEHGISTKMPQFGALRIS